MPKLGQINRGEREGEIREVSFKLVKERTGETQFCGRIQYRSQ